MLVCHCHALTDKDIRRAALRTGGSIAELRLGCPASSKCGGCRSEVERIAREAVASPSRNSLAL